MMEDTPSNYNIANQRFEQTSDLLTAKGQQLQQQNNNPIRVNDQVQEEEDESQFDGDYAAGDDNLMRKKKRVKKRKKIIQIYNDPSEKDKLMAKAYGGVPRGTVKKIITKTVVRDVSTPVSQAHGRTSKAAFQRVSGVVNGFNRDSLSRVGDLEEMKNDQHNVSMPGMMTNQSNYLNDSNEPSILAVPEHHVREQRLKQRKMNELKSKRKGKKMRGGGGDPDFEKMFGKDIDEFLEDSDWDIESFENMSNFSKGTSRSALHDGRIRGLESIYLQRIETSMKRGGALQSRKMSKKPA